MSKTEELKLKRSTSAEKSAVNGILMLFTDKWEEVYYKSSREVATLVLMQLKNACVTESREDITEEHLKLLHFNQYVNRIIKQLKGDVPLSIPLNEGNTFDDILDFLKKISRATTGEEYEKDIRSRFNFFIKKLNDQRILILQEEAKSKRKALIISAILSIVFSVILYGVIALTMDYIDSEIIVLGLLAFIATAFGAFATLYKVLKDRF